MADIIVPVFNAIADLRCCLQALQEHAAPTQAILLIDDASTDPNINPLLSAFCATRPNTTLLSNSQNLGFVGTANRAMAATTTDVVLLNSDTQVTNGWLDALIRCAASDPMIATATPFSNNAEICSLPEFCVNNPLPARPADWAQAVTRTASRQYPDLPTGVGFCMYIRRQALVDLGLFDTAYGRGYGEENDFCQRAARAGWRNVLCDDAFVAHAGGKSFSPLGLAPNGDNLRVLLDRFPHYEQDVAEFIAKDPIAPIRRAIMANYVQTH